VWFAVVYRDPRGWGLWVAERLSREGLTEFSRTEARRIAGRLADKYRRELEGT
jgi:hypothetical protein